MFWKKMAKIDFFYFVWVEKVNKLVIQSSLHGNLKMEILCLLWHRARLIFLCFSTSASPKEVENEEKCNFKTFSEEEKLIFLLVGKNPWMLWSLKSGALSQLSEAPLKINEKQTSHLLPPLRHVYVFPAGKRDWRGPELRQIWKTSGSVEWGNYNFSMSELIPVWSRLWSISVLKTYSGLNSSSVASFSSPNTSTQMFQGSNIGLDFASCLLWEQVSLIKTSQRCNSNL